MGRHIYDTSSPGRMVMHLAAEFFRSAVRILVGGRRRWSRRKTGRAKVQTADRKVYRRLHYHSATAYAKTNSSPHQPTAWTRVCH